MSLLLYMYAAMCPFLGGLLYLSRNFGLHCLMVRGSSKVFFQRNWNYLMMCSFLYKLEVIVSIEFIPTNHQETFKVTTGAPPPGVSTLEGQNWKLQFPGMKLALEGGNGVFWKTHVCRSLVSQILYESTPSFFGEGFSTMTI